MLDKATLQALLKEAKSEYKYCKKEFEKTDCCEAMNAMESWESAVGWLGGKLDEIKEHKKRQVVGVAKDAS